METEPQFHMTGLFVGVIALILLVIQIGVLIWVYTDAERRGKSGCLVMLLVFFLAFPAGLIAWLIFRPPIPKRTMSYMPRE